MQSMILIFALILAAIVSIFLAQIFPRISINYISMVIGALFFLLPAFRGSTDNFNSEIFMGIIVAPLLFFEGQATRLNFVGRKLWHILQMTIVLVLIDFVLAGLAIKALIPISMPLAFIMAAISTPTDATAMTSVTNGLRIPRKNGALLKMESLFNDASGIILLNMALLWYVNGFVNIPATVGNFLYSAVGGVIFGFALAWLIILFRQKLLRSTINALNAQVLLYLVTPFTIYFLGEMIHVSGIIAVVSAGLVHNAEVQRSRLINPPQIHFGVDLVAMVTEVFNSIVFVILGFLFVSIISAKRLGDSPRWIIIGAILYLVNIIVRYAFSRVRFKMNNRDGWIFSLGGVHGAVTLSLAYLVSQLHVTSADAKLVLCSASVLIILSLIVPTIVFRFILPKLSTEKEVTTEAIKLRKTMADRGIETVEKMYLPDNVKKSVIFDLTTQNQTTATRDFISAWADVVRHSDFSGSEKELEMRAFMNAFAQERQYLDAISQSEVKYQSCVYELYNEVLLAESLVVGPNVFDESEK